MFFFLTRRSLKRVCSTLDNSDYKRVRDKFANQFNYSVDWEQIVLSFYINKHIPDVVKLLFDTKYSLQEYDVHKLCRQTWLNGMGLGKK